MFASTAMQIRLSLAVVDRGLEVNEKLVVARRVDEPMEHVVLRILAYCLFYRDDAPQCLRFALGPADRDSPDLWAHDLVGYPIDWVVCGEPDAEELAHVLRHQRQATVRVLFGSVGQRQGFFDQVRSMRRRVMGLEAVEFREVDAGLVELLAAREEERQRWSVTLVEDHLYVDADGVSADSEVTQVRAPQDGHGMGHGSGRGQGQGEREGEGEAEAKGKRSTPAQRRERP